MATSAQTKLLCHFNGANGATTYTSDDANARVATFYGSAQLSTAQKKFGTASLLLASATSDYITFPDSADWTLGTGNWTIDFRVYFNSLPTAGNYCYIYNRRQDDLNRWGLIIYNDSGNYCVELYIVYSGGNIDYYPVTNPNFTTGTWYHIAIVRNGTNFAIYQDGTSLGSTTSSLDLTSFTAPLYIGQKGTGSNYFDGYIDEFRIVVGSAEWTTNFTPPTSEYSFLLTGVSYMES